MIQPNTTTHTTTNTTTPPGHHLFPLHPRQAASPRALAALALATDTATVSAIGTTAMTALKKFDISENKIIELPILFCELRRRIELSDRCVQKPVQATRQRKQLTVLYCRQVGFFLPRKLWAPRGRGRRAEGWGPAFPFGFSQGTQRRRGVIS